MIDHIVVKVGDFARSQRFYDSTLSAIDLTRLFDVPGVTAGYGTAPRPFFWIGASPAAGLGCHVAFAVETRDAVDRFHAAALAAGARDNGAPGLRPQYHPDYYGAFVLDPDGNNIEAVCHAPA